MSELITKSEFARRMGVDPKAVTRAIKDGRIFVTLNADGREMIDAVTAAKQWSDNSRFRIEASRAAEIARRGDDDAPEAQVESHLLPTISESRIVREHYDAQLAKLEYEKERGKFIGIDESRRAWSAIATAARTRLLGVPSSAKIRMPELTAGQIATIEELIRDALSDVADGVMTFEMVDEINDST